MKNFTSAPGLKFQSPPTSSDFSKQIASKFSSRQHFSAAKPLAPAPITQTFFVAKFIFFIQKFSIRFFFFFQHKIFVMLVKLFFQTFQTYNFLDWNWKWFEWKFRKFKTRLKANQIKLGSFEQQTWRDSRFLIFTSRFLSRDSRFTIRCTVAQFKIEWKLSSTFYSFLDSQ